MTQVKPALLEEWMRLYYFGTDIDIGSSGVEDFSLGEVRLRTGLTTDVLDRLVLRDSSSYGGDGVRRAVADRWGNGDPDWVMVTHGSSEAIYLIMTTVLSAGDEVVVLEPAYHSLRSIAEAIGCTVKSWCLRTADGYQPDVDGLRALVTPRTKVIVVNFPNNPTGATISPAGRRDLISIAEESGAYLFWDAAFRDLVFDDPPLPDVTADYPRGVSCGTLSKAYGLPGLRFGWCLAPPDVLAATVHLRDRMTLHLSPLTELIAEHVIAHANELLAPRLEQAAHNRALLRSWVEEHGDVVELVPPHAGVTAFPRLPAVADVEEFCHRLAKEDRLLVVPGASFGEPAHVRVGFGGSRANFPVGLDRLAAALQRYCDNGR